MPGLRNLIGAVVGLAAVASALPALPRLNERALKMYEVKRQVTATGLPADLTDVDILQFALTLENLETAFYQQGFAKFPDSDFTALGLTTQDIANLKMVAMTEATHVTTLMTAISAAGTQPVAPCTYNFGFTTAQNMIATANVLENIGVSAYLGAAPLISSKAVLTVAAEIVTVESRHQTFIRTASKVSAVPSAFDTPLGIRNVFSLAAPLFLPLTTTAQGATACAFTNGGQTGGTAFTPFANGACTVPQGLAGDAYLNLASQMPATGVLTDDITVAGPLVLAIS
ncbi:putative twin-arginine translocation pathway signal protein [Botrytis fragariae]|uniref:Putative twin-arginine translocation pathway signal protein n=1 Tax=Botrytis fragariae TaxID=1964551 RepID=A0A8H6AP35_9HELO|nr:putative twin-arginine translocation pathway signal protein [Botrytis fragariae]KAF5871196.1 putative twin-arginine translocation pathway signal protein [Botrytis fragariae]